MLIAPCRRARSTCGDLILVSIAVLIVGLGWKAAAGTRGPGQEPKRLDAVVQFLRARGFRNVRLDNTNETARVNADGLFGCRLTVLRGKREGWDQYALRQSVSAADDIFFVFAGSTYSEYPN